MAVTSPGESQKFHLGNFDGPLDLLLYLIRKSEINVYDIPIAAITEQYLEYMSYATRIDLDNITEFQLMAATLLLIKSKMLLPVDVDLDEELEDPRRDLVEMLIEYQKYRKLSELMAEREQAAEWVIDRKKAQQILPFPEEELWEQVGVWDLLKTFSTIISSLTPERAIDLYEEVTVNEKIALIYELLESRAEFIFNDLITKRDSIMEVICSFLAVLELAKLAVVLVFQNRLFGDILVKARAGRESDGA
jgi:segregation and condensation protein A